MECISASRIRDLLPDLCLLARGDRSHLFACQLRGNRAVLKVLHDGAAWSLAYPINPEQHTPLLRPRDWIEFAPRVHDLRDCVRLHCRNAAHDPTVPPLVHVMRYEAQMACVVKHASVPCMQPIGYAGCTCTMTSHDTS